MSQSVEVSGPDIESAVAQALAKLGATRNQVQIEVLEEPTRRLLGLGVRPARVRVTVSEELSATAPLTPRPAPETAAAPHQAAPPQTALSDTGAPANSTDKTAKTDKTVVLPDAKPINKPIEKRQPVAVPPDVPDLPRADPHAPAEPHDQRERAFAENDDDHSPQPIDLTDAQSDREAQVGVEIVQKLIGYLGITADVKARRAEAVDSKDTRHWVLEISGEELAMLIGSKGETLGALQYLTRLIAARMLGHRVNLVVDVAGYKSHREDMLRRLAKRMASQVLDTNRAVSLEPMPPHERRIIHLALRDHPSVKTESVGEGEKRKVTIVPRRNKV